MAIVSGSTSQPLSVTGLNRFLSRYRENVRVAPERIIAEMEKGVKVRRQRNRSRNDGLSRVS
ncbi:MAG TPA: hypothetical protein EYN27_04970 [Rhodospirillales bacterium]|nr:hypothetical protein [Rhodospirillales bacterium]